MRRNTRAVLTTVLALASVVALAACGSSSSSSSAASSSSSSSSGSTPKTGSVTIAAGTFPQSLDPQMDYTTQGAEINWIAYTGLTTYAHANGKAGTAVIPGLCTNLPTVSDGGKTYTCTLRSGLKFSDGTPVVASDFTYAVERSIQMPWGGSGAFITPIIVGGTAFQANKAKTISGITTNDSTGQITIHLTAAYGPFLNVLAFPTLGLIDPKTAPLPAKNQPSNPPAGVGPYEVVKSSIVPNTSFEAIPNPNWASYNIPGIPAGHTSVTWKVDSNVTANAEAVLNNSADVFDWAETAPGSLLPQIRAQAASRFQLVNLGGSTYYIFMNSQEKPFNNPLAREAVVEGLDEQAFVKLGAGTLIPACYFLPPFVPGHPSGATCPYNNSTFTGNLAKAQALVKQSGEAGASVTVWSQERPPRQQWMTYYTSYLNQLGFHATQKLISDAAYFTTIGELKLHPQTGFADWNMDYPNPVDFYLLVTKTGILPTNNQNFGEVNDPHVNSMVTSLEPTPTAQLSSVTPQWQSLDEYLAKKAYLAVFGYQTFPKFTSTRINYGAAIMQPEYGWDWTSFALK